jgi:hypothetical protein
MEGMQPLVQRCGAGNDKTINTRKPLRKGSAEIVTVSNIFKTINPLLLQPTLLRPLFITSLATH